MSNNPSSSGSGDSRGRLEPEDDREGILTRWSRRKARARRGKCVLGGASDDQSGTIGTASHAAEPTPAASPAPEAPSDLPDPEQLDIAADFTVFLRDGVDPLLRRAALRRLWTLDPVFAWQDGLVEYGEDFTDSAKSVPVVQTAFQTWDMLSELTNSIPSNAVAESSSQTSDAAVAERLGEMEPPRDEGCDQNAHDDQRDLRHQS